MFKKSKYLITALTCLGLGVVIANVNVNKAQAFAVQPFLDETGLYSAILDNYVYRQGTQESANHVLNDLVKAHYTINQIQQALDQVEYIVHREERTVHADLARADDLIKTFENRILNDFLQITTTGDDSYKEVIIKPSGKLINAYNDEPIKRAIVKVLDRVNADHGWSKLHLPEIITGLKAGKSSVYGGVPSFDLIHRGNLHYLAPKSNQLGIVAVETPAPKDCYEFMSMDRHGERAVLIIPIAGAITEANKQAIIDALAADLLKANGNFDPDWARRSAIKTVDGLIQNKKTNYQGQIKHLSWVATY